MTDRPCRWVTDTRDARGSPGPHWTLGGAPLQHSHWGCLVHRLEFSHRSFAALRRSVVHYLVRPPARSVAMAEILRNDEFEQWALEMWLVTSIVGRTLGGLNAEHAAGATVSATCCATIGGCVAG